MNMNEPKRHICKYMKACQTLEVLYPPTSRFAKFKRKCRELILVSEENGRKCYTPQGNAGYIYQKEKQLTQSPNMIHPYSKFCQYWETAAIVEFFVAFLVRSFLVSLQPKCVFDPWYQIPSLFSDLFETTDVLLRFRTGYMDKELQEVVLESQKVHLHNFKRFHLYSDLTVSLPVQFIGYVLSLDGGIIHRYLNFFVLCKIVKLYTMKRYLSHSAKIHNWSELQFLIVWASIFNFYFCHSIVCAFCMDDANDFFGWLFKIFGVRGKDNCFFLYVRTFYTIVMTVIDHEDFGESLSNQTFTSKVFYCITIVILNINAILFIGLFLQLLAFMRNPAIVFAEMKQEVQKFLALESLPKHIHVKAMKYLDFRYTQKYFNEENILKTLSPPLRREVKKFLCFDLVKRQNSIFQTLPDAVAIELCLLMKLEYYLPGDAIQEFGKKSGKVYFLYSGSVAIYNVYGKEIMHWYAGQQFGFSCFLKVPVHPVTTIALEMTEVYVLRYADFLNLVREAPTYLEEVKAAAALRRAAYAKLLLAK